MCERQAANRGRRTWDHVEPQTLNTDRLECDGTKKTSNTEPQAPPRSCGSPPAPWHPSHPTALVRTAPANPWIPFCRALPCAVLPVWPWTGWSAPRPACNPPTATPSRAPKPVFAAVRGYEPGSSTTDRATMASAACAWAVVSVVHAAPPIVEQRRPEDGADLSVHGQGSHGGGLDLSCVSRSLRLSGFVIMFQTL